MTLPDLHHYHPRIYGHNKFVYPVLSRRSRGISLGINLNPDKICNFDCIYCQVDRRSESETQFVETERMLAELSQLLELVITGALFEDAPFDAAPVNRRRLNDIAFSGDGEPTTFRNFDDIVAQVARLAREKLGERFSAVKLVLITNASMFHRPAVARGLATLDANHGEIWAKLDAGTDAYYQKIERTRIPFQQVLDNILSAARVRPLVIQSLFMRVQGVGPDTAEIDAFCHRLLDVVSSGGQLKLIQIYTVARPPAESFVTPLSAEEVASIAERVRTITKLPVESFV